MVKVAKSKSSKTKKVTSKTKQKETTPIVENINNEVKPNKNDEFEFDEVKALEDAIKNMEKDGGNSIELPEIAQIALKEVKNAAKVSETIDINNIESSKNTITETLDKLTDLEKKLEDDINEKMSSLTKNQKNILSKSNFFDLGKFWNGISNGWD